MNMLIEYLSCEDSAHIRWTNDIPGVRACQFTVSELPKNKIVMIPKWESYSGLTVFFCLSGQIVVQAQDAKPEKIEKHHVVVTDNSALRIEEIGNTVQGILVHIDGQTAQESAISAYALMGLPLNIDLLKAKLVAQNGYIHFCSSYWTEAIFGLLPNLPEDMRVRYCVLKAWELLYIVGTQEYKMPHFLGEWGGGQGVKCVLDAQKYMQAHISEKISISDLSDKLSVSPTYLKAEFRRMCGTSVHQWKIELRMRRAGELIRCTDKQIHKIAQEVGYEGMSKFCAVFKRYYGITPGQFKKCPKPESEVFLINDKEKIDQYNNGSHSILTKE